MYLKKLQIISLICVASVVSAARAEDTIAVRDEIIKVVISDMADGSEYAQKTIGAYFYEVRSEDAKRFLGFLEGHKPRVEIGTENLQTNGIYRDRVTGLLGILLKASVQEINGDDAKVSAVSISGPVGASQRTFYLRREQGVWKIVKRKNGAVS